ncbi:MAG: hypothetical protein QOH78_2373, partial [Verrucomicrobiota bacterium]
LYEKRRRRANAIFDGPLEIRAPKGLENIAQSLPWEKPQTECALKVALECRHVKERFFLGAT